MAETWSQSLFENVDSYISDLYSLQDDALAATERSITESNIPQISISRNQGKFLYLLAKLVKASKILEMGTLAGTAPSGWQGPCLRMVSSLRLNWTSNTRPWRN